MTFKTATAVAFALLSVAACDQIEQFLDDEPAQEEQVALYQSVPAQRRNITVSVEAAGIIEPVTTVEVKSKASGEILELPVDTGDYVQAGTLLARIDRRVLNNSLQTAKANLEVAKARQANAQSQLERISKLYEQESLSKVDWEQSLLDNATARSEVVRGEIQVENATIQLGDADVNSPITGTVIERLVEQGQVISSPMGDVGGGTLLMQMADLSHVQVRMLVDEIDIGKVRPGTIAQVNVAAYPNRPFQGEVVKVEPQAVAEQNVTMFPVLIDLENRDGLLKPGMNAEVEVVMARRENVITIPNAALRTPEDIYAAGGVLGLDQQAVDRMLAGAPRCRRRPAFPTRGTRRRTGVRPGTYAGDLHEAAQWRGTDRGRAKAPIPDAGADARPGRATWRPPPGPGRRGTRRAQKFDRGHAIRRRLHGLRATRPNPDGVAHPHRDHRLGPCRSDRGTERRRPGAHSAERLAGARPRELPATHEPAHGDSGPEPARQS